MGKQKKRRNRHMRQVGFQLDLVKPDENQMFDRACELAAKDKKAETVRDGFRLVYALRYEDDVSVFRQMFPELYYQIRNDAIVAELAALKTLMEAKQLTIQPSQSSGLNPLDGMNKKIEMPTFDEDDFQPLTKRLDTSLNTAQGFLDAAIGFKAQEVSNDDGE